MDTQRNKQLPPEAAHSVGRVTIDSRGRNVWQWNDNQLDSTTIMLARLDNSALALEPTLNAKAPEFGKQPVAGRHSSRIRDKRRRDTDVDLAVEQTFNVKLGGGFDPYNRG